MPAVLYVDPDEGAAREATEAFEAAGLDVVGTAGTKAAALEALNEGVDCVVTEYELPDASGFELVHAVRERAPDTVCVLYTAAEPDAIPTGGEQTVVDCYFKAATPPDRLAALVESAVGLRSHTAYPLPADESDRLAVLESLDLVSHSVRRALERVSSLAADHFDVPTASVNAIEADTQTFLACHGADWTETAREDSICTYAIVDDDPVTVIEDAAADPRFADNEALDRLGIRFYAGADLTVRGATVGTLCIYDEEPRTFGGDDRDYLALLAEEAAHLLAVHHDLARARDGGSS